MLSFFIFLAAVAASQASAGYAGNSAKPGNNVVQEQHSSPGGYGYSGSYSGSYPGNFGAPPQFPQFDFSGFLNNYLDSIRKYHEQFINNIPQGAQGGYQANNYPGQAYAGSSSGGFGGGSGFGSGFGSGSSYGSGFSGSYGGGFPNPAGFAQNFGGPGSGGAAASASIGPQGIHQTAQVYPENPNSPNVDNRFGSTQGKPNGGYYGVFTSSSSHSSNVGGKPQSFHQAQTTVNDNGKVTTFTSKNP